MNPVLVNVYRDRLVVKFPVYSVSDKNRLKEIIPGARWNQTGQYWGMKLTWDNCTLLRETFGARLEIKPPLRKWAWSHRKTRVQLEEYRDGNVDDDALFNVKGLAPDLFNAVSSRRYQMAGAAFATTGRNVLLGDQPGLGKTYQALAAVVNSKQRRILIIAPRTAVRSVWESHIKKLCPFMVPTIAQGTRQKRIAQIAEFNNRAQALQAMPEGTNYTAALVINKEMMRVKRMYVCQVAKDKPGTDGKEFPKPPGKKGGCPMKNSHEHTHRYYPEYPELFGTPWDYIVMDESHHALASRYGVTSDNITQIRLGAMRLPLAKGGLKLAMSGTPYRSKAQKAWGTLSWLNPKEFSTFWGWADKFFNVTEDRYSRVISPNPKDPEAFADAMRPYLLARTKAEVAPELPPIEYAGTSPDGSDDGPIGVWLDMEGDQAKAYERMRELAEADVANGRITATGVLAELTRLRQFAGCWGEMVAGERNKMVPALPSNKYDWLLDFLRERDGFGGKVIVTSQFTSLLNLFRDALRKEGYDPLMLTGATSDSARITFQKRIQDPDDPAWIGLLNMKAGGEAITLDQADDMIMLDLPWTDDEIRQVEDRLHRISRIHNVTVYRLQSRGTVEERIAMLTDQQRKDLMALRPAGKKLLAGILGK